MQMMIVLYTKKIFVTISSQIQYIKWSFHLQVPTLSKSLLIPIKTKERIMLRKQKKKRYTTMTIMFLKRKIRNNKKFKEREKQILKMTISTKVEKVHRKKANKNQLAKGTGQVIDIYQVRGLIVKQFTADNEVECIRENIRRTRLIVVGVGEHVGPVVRFIRTIQNGTRVYVNSLPYLRFPG